MLVAGSCRQINLYTPPDLPLPCNELTAGGRCQDIPFENIRFWSFDYWTFFAVLIKNPRSFFMIVSTFAFSHFKTKETHGGTFWRNRFQSLLQVFSLEGFCNSQPEEVTRSIENAVERRCFFHLDLVLDMNTDMNNWLKILQLGWLDWCISPLFLLRLRRKTVRSLLNRYSNLGLRWIKYPFCRPPGL